MSVIRLCCYAKKENADCRYAEDQKGGLPAQTSQTRLHGTNGLTVISLSTQNERNI